MRKLRALLRRFWMLFAGERERNDYAMQYAKLAWAFVFGRGVFVRQIWGKVPDPDASKDVALFVHYDKNGTVHAYVLAYLQGLKDAGRSVVFITNSPRFPEAERRKLDGLASQVIWRKNKGYDFGAYADGMRLLGETSTFRTITLCNDSVYGPLFPLKDIFKRMDPKQADIWSLTDSWDTRHHLQSYFLLFHQNALNHPEFQKYWRSYLHVASKSWVIRKHEIGLSTHMRKAGLVVKPLFPYRDLLDDFFERMGDASILNDEDLTPGHRRYLAQVYDYAERGQPLNMTHFFWDRLIVKFGYPFIKREILQSNPMGLPGLYRWEKMVKAVSDYDTSLITRHLEFTMRGRFM